MQIVHSRPKNHSSNYRGDMMINLCFATCSGCLALLAKRPKLMKPIELSTFLLFPFGEVVSEQELLKHCYKMQCNEKLIKFRKELSSIQFILSRQ
jgi:hypothetical protein